MFDIKNHWENVAKNINSRKDKNKLAGYDSLLDRKIREKFLYMLGSINFKDKRVVELGCGTGLNLAYIHKFGPKKLMGIDISKNMISIARETLVKESIIDCDFLQTDGENIPLNERKFDIGLTVTVLQHNSNVESLRRLVANFTKIVDNKCFIFEDIAKKNKGTEDYMLRPISFYEELFALNGFKLVSQQNINMYFTQKVFSFLNRFMGLYREEEGAVASKTLFLMQRIFYPITSLADKMLVSNEGLAMMVFERVGDGADIN